MTFQDPAATAPARHMPRWAEILLVAAVACLLAVLLQNSHGVYQADLWDDEASHYTTGMMMRAWLLRQGPLNPVSFIKWFHGHYPLVGLGHWGPVAYVVEAFWLLIAGPSQAAALFLSAMQAATLAALLYAAAAPRVGRSLALTTAFILIMLPIIQGGEDAVMLDLPVAILSFAAALSYAAFLRGRHPMRHAILFAVLAASAMLVKGNGLALALLPPFALVLTRRFALLRTAAFWLPAPIVAILAGPWTLLTYGQVAAGFRYHAGAGYTATALQQNGLLLLQNFGPLLLALGLAAWVLTALRPGGARHAMPPGTDAVPAALAALAAAGWVFQSVAPAAIQDRYLAPIAAPLLFLAALGLQGLLAALRAPLWARPLAAAAAAALPLAAAAGVPRKPVMFTAPAVDYIASHLDPANPSVLVVADSPGETAAIAGLLQATARTSPMFVVRGARLLGGGGYNTSDFKLRFANAQDAANAIRDAHIRYVLLRSTGQPGEWGDVAQVAGIASQWTLRFSARLTPCGSDFYPNQPVTCALRVYELPDKSPLPDHGAALLGISAPHGL